MPRPQHRPPHDPSEKLRKRVEHMVAIGFPQPDIAKVIGISEPTLRKHYRDELDCGRAVVTAKISRRLARMALGEVENATAADELRAGMFYLKTRAGWSEDSAARDVTPEAKPLTINIASAPAVGPVRVTRGAPAADE